MKRPGGEGDLRLKIAIAALVGVVLVPAAAQGMIDGYQQWGSTTYRATVTTAPSSADCTSTHLVTFQVAGGGPLGSVLTKDTYNASQTVTAVFHPAALWAPGYWELLTRGGCPP